MDPVKTDSAFYHNLLINKFHLLLHIAQCVSFLPYPSYVLRQAVDRRHGLRTWALRWLNGTVGVLCFSISLLCYFLMYIYYPELMYKGNLPAVIHIMYHVENWLRVLLVLVALVGPRLSERFLRETIDTLVLIMKRFDRVAQMQGVLGASAIIANRLLLLYCCHTLIVTVTVWISTEHPVSTLLNVNYLAPYVTIAVYILLYQALLSSVGGIVRCLNDSLREVTLLEKNHPERPYGRHTTISYIQLDSANQAQAHSLHVTVATIEKLSTLHMGLMRLTREANNHFGVLMLIILLSTFIQINMILIELYHNIGHPTLPEYCLWILFLHAIVHFTFFFVIAKSNHAIQQQVPCADRLIPTLANGGHFPLQNERTMLLLHEFKCSWSNEQNVADIHQACGMINLDMKLIANVVAAITSIMVVLIQFSDTGL
ncbi:putative gustatory receptor 59f isoform X2 [Anopheles stephensi]|uniref:putative gustatory receptor 59f isoform X2 n=1 Tax=Anopheles stephensi TaxID=30069 RepID=UPI001658AF98|nr:putative gustatory receptor 59f isoform X2 [Anopheles stephensi]